jgi:hypothetical protein
MCADTIARVRITLDDVEPTILRRIEAPLDIRLERLHLTIQAAMGWDNKHLYEMRAGDVGWSTPYPEADWAGFFVDAREVRLVDVIEVIGTSGMKYLYDFGDGWEHTVRIERLFDPEPGITYPRLTEAKRRCPPEDVGGPLAYVEFVEAMQNPRHKRHKERRQWFGGDFDPERVDQDRLADEIAALAKQWSRKISGKRKRRT